MVNKRPPNIASSGYLSRPSFKEKRYKIIIIRLIREACTNFISILGFIRIIYFQVQSRLLTNQIVLCDQMYFNSSNPLHLHFFTEFIYSFIFAILTNITWTKINLFLFNGVIPTINRFNFFVAIENCYIPD